jgi:pimeloyl-ACP methyl ester carboxylesterase
MIRFGPFQLDSKSRELRRDDRVISLRPKSFQLLTYMTEHLGRLLTKDELLDAGWGKTAVSDGVLKVCIREIREALGDDPREPRYVQTVHRVGYRFMEIKPRGTSQGDRSVAFGGPVQYAKSGNVHIAYRIFGDGPRDIVLIPGTLSHVELLWQHPSHRHLLKRLTAFARVIVYDKRGQGLSDRAAGVTIEERMDDIRAVMDAADSRAATIYGWSEGGTVSLMFAATHPERTSALVLYGAYACMRDGVWTVTAEDFERFLGALEKRWGQGILVRMNAPSRSNDQEVVKWFGKIERAAASPGAVLALMRTSYEADVRHVLRTLAVPTLILHRVGDALTPVAAGRYLAAEIPGAKYVELAGDDHLVLDPETQDAIADEIEEFITGAHLRPEPDRMLATLMFSDAGKLDTTAGEISQRRMAERLDGFRKIMAGELALSRGREVSNTGAALAAFDGPARAIRCACTLREKARELGLHVRIGLHAGECELIGGGVGGVAVHIAEQVAHAAKPDEVLVSGTVKDLVAGSGIRFADRGTRQLEGVPGEWRLFVVQ